MKLYRAVFFVVILFSNSIFADDADYKGRQVIEPLLKSLENERGTSRRIELASERLLGTPFVGGPLGEGANAVVDAHPLCRADGFDCTTYVETVLAIAFSKDWDGFERTLDRIRYRNGEISFTSRNHFPETDWIPNLIQEFLFRDVTADIGKNATETAETTIKKSAWYAKMDAKRLFRPDLDDEGKEKVLRELRFVTKNIPDEAVELHYIPFSKVIQISKDQNEERRKIESEIRTRLKGKPDLASELRKNRREFLASNPTIINQQLLERIQAPVIISYVNPDQQLEDSIGTNMLVTHQGFLIRKGGVLYARHASLRDKVIDVPFLEYISMFLVDGKRGFNILLLE